MLAEHHRKGRDTHGRARDGATVTDLTAWLVERGHAVSRSATGRYTKRWQEREAERVELLDWRRSSATWRRPLDARCC